MHNSVPPNLWLPGSCLRPSQRSATSLGAWLRRRLYCFIKSNSPSLERPGRLPRHRAAGRSSPETSREAGPPPSLDPGGLGGVTRAGPGEGAEAGGGV